MNEFAGRKLLIATRFPLDVRNQLDRDDTVKLLIAESLISISESLSILAQKK